MPRKLIKPRISFPSSDSSSESDHDEPLGLGVKENGGKRNVLRSMKKGVERIRSISFHSPKKPSSKSVVRALESVTHVILTPRHDRAVSLPLELPPSPSRPLPSTISPSSSSSTMASDYRRDEPARSDVLDNETVSQEPQSPRSPSAEELSHPSDSLPPIEDTTLDVPPVSSTPVTPTTPNVNKDVPPPPAEETIAEEEEEVPELYLPGLVIPTMFLPIPNTDPLTTLLNKYIYPPDKRPVRDLSGEWQNSNFHAMVMTNSWRALARMARDRIVATDPEELSLILGLWYLRLACLSRLRLFNQTSVECNNLFSVLNAVEPPETKAYLFDRLLPFELEVMYTRLKYWAGDHMSYLDSLYELLKKCRTKARTTASDDTTVAMWKERGARICLIIASQLMEMKEYSAACKLLEPLLDQEYEAEDLSSPTLRSAIARIYLQSGYISMAKKHFDVVDKDSTAEQAQKEMNKALLASANGEWKVASETLTALLEREEENFTAVNNLSVALLSQGRLKEGIDVLEKALRSSPSTVVVAEPFLFNLSTLYELRSATATQKKLELLIEVAKWSGDGLKVSCLKMPSN
ncbi:hypothetical protein VNI00_000786 [Paramarasmius palmivorus]|uniref:Tetratricopeptide repeat protein 15 n=1 Tax=Paramarasmius palmivorus TaxID=297713 RepID=A0AAW0E686_9AGAR